VIEKVHLNEAEDRQRWGGLTRRCICRGRAGGVLMFGELSATIVLGACGRRGPQACVTAARSCS
jgi:hypothetical protein